MNAYEIPAGDQITRRALLIGVCTYPKIPSDWGSDLAGCHNDVANLRRVLLQRGFEDSHIRVLIDSEEGFVCPFSPGTTLRSEALPTRQGILDAVDQLVDTCDANDIVVLYYSGHGSEITGRRLQAGRRFQSLVPHDSGRGTEPNRDISDGEIQSWLRRLRAKTPYVTMIFDCCHSGGLSNVRSGGHGVRQVLADDRTEDDAYDGELLRQLVAADASPVSPLSGGHRGTASVEVQAGGIVLSASAAHELSSETVSEGRKVGLFTHRLCQTLEATPDKGIEGASWADVFPKVTAAVTGENLAQHPRRQGNGPIFQTGPVDPDDVDPPDVVELHKLAVVIGIDYDTSELALEERPKNGFSPLRTPHRDAQEVARMLEEVQGYEVVGLSKRSPGPLLGAKATRKRIHKLIHRLIDVRARRRRDCAVLIYFAGHGVTRTLDDGSQAGYLVPWGAEQDDPSTWLPMQDLRDHLVDGIREAERLASIGVDKPLTRLTSRHLLLVLDCCFGGAMSYDFFRSGDGAQRPIYYSEYRRFVEGRAWQLLNSASYNQQAMDRNPKDPEQPYSPFAQAMIDGLSSAAADRQLGGRSDQIITAAELHQFIDGQLRRQGVDVQTPGLVDLRPREGQYIFHVPGAKPTPLPDPPLDPAHNPWPGERPYDDPELFFGRRQATLDLLEAFLQRGDQDLLLTGPSGCGKTSLVAAGLMPILDDPVVGRERLRQELEYSGDDVYLVRQDDVKALRQWLEEQAIDVAWTDTDLVAAMRAAARSCGWLDSSAGEHTVETGSQQRTSLGMPSFQEADSVETSLSPDWWRRLDLSTWLSLPESYPLTRRLRLWAEEGGLVDFFSSTKGAARRALGAWQVVTAGPEAPLADDLQPPADDGPGLLLWIDGFFSLAEAEAACAASSSWPALKASPQVLRLVCVSKHSPEETNPWQHLPVLHPTADEVRDMVQGPANARVLEFDPPQLVDRMLEVVAPMPSPLPTMSTWLSYAVDHAWQRRKDADRQLSWRDALDTDVESWLTRRAESVSREVLTMGTAYRSSLRNLLLRFLSPEGAPAPIRRVNWEEIDKFDADASERLHRDILPRFLRRRVLVADAQGVRLAHPGLLSRWPRLRRWTSQRGVEVRRALELWPRAAAWRSAHFDLSHLLTQDRHLTIWVRRHRQLSRLEAALVGCSEMMRRCDLVMALTARAGAGLLRDWPQSALLAAEAADVSIRNARWMEDLQTGLKHQAPNMKERFLPILQSFLRSQHSARQTLHNVLATTPLAWVPEVPEMADGTLRGLDITSRWVRIRLEGSNSAGEPVQRIFAWGLDDVTELAQEAEATDLEDGTGEVTARQLPGGPLFEFPMVPEGPHRGPKAQTGHDQGIRLFPPGRHGLPAEITRLIGSPITLWGHTATPRFLAFSKDRRWLASAAQSPGQQPQVRLWPLRPSGTQPAQPQTFLDRKLEDLASQANDQNKKDLMVWHEASLDSPDADFSFPRRLLSVHDLPATLPCDDGTWQLRQASGTVVAYEADRGLHLTVWGTAMESPVGHRLAPPRRALEALRRLESVESLQCLAFSPRGRWLAVLSTSQQMALWNLRSGALAWRGDGISCIAFHPTSDAVTPDMEAPLAVLGTDRGTLRLLQGNLSQALPDYGDLGRISSLAFSPDGGQLAIGTLDGTVRLVDITEAGRKAEDPSRQPLVLKGPRDQGFAVQELRFDTAGHRLAVQRRAVYEPFATRVDLYQLDEAALICLARGHAGRPLEASDMAPELWRQLLDCQHLDLDGESAPDSDSIWQQTRRRYASVLGLLQTSRKT